MITTPYERSRPAEILVVVGSAWKKRCKWCRRTILLATVASREHLAAHAMAFESDAVAVERKVNEHTGVKFDVFLATDRHNCPERPKKDRTQKRLVESARVGQGRIW